jgi:plastocyanin
MNNKRMMAGVSILVAIVAVGLSACGPKTTTLDVEMKDFTFAPDKWTVPAGGEVTLNVKNTGSVVHEWVIIKKGETVDVPWADSDEAKIFWELDDVEPGDVKSVTFTAPTEPGDYQIVCGQPAHIEQGMVGTLTVTP